MPPKVDVFMPWFIGDYVRDTPHLMAEEHGAYLMILGALWNMNGSLPADHDRLYSIARVPASRWPHVWRVIEPFFTVEDGRITQKRLTAELERAREHQEKASERGRRLAEKRWSRRGECDTHSATQSAAHSDAECSPPPPPPPHSTSTAVPPRERTAARARESKDQGNSQDHPLADPARTDLDADPKKSPHRIPPARTADTPEDPAAAEARALAHAAAQQWQADRLAFAPRARECQPGEWSILEPDFSARLMPHALELSGELLPCLKWAMADVRSGPGFPGWRTVLRSPQKVLDALRDGAMVEQWRAATTTEAAPIRREPRDPRRGTCYGATAEEIAADAAKYAGGRAR